MTVIRGRRALIAATTMAASLAIALTGCSSSSNSTASSGSNGSTASADLGLKESGTLNLAADFSASPNQFINDGKKDGLNVALCEQLGSEMGLKVNWTNLAFDSLIPGLQANRYDALCTAVFITKAREQVMNMVPYVQWGDTLAVKNGDAAQYACGSEPSPCWSKLAGKTVATESGGAEVDELNEANKSLSNKIKIQQFDSNTQVYQAIANSSVDAIFVNDPQFSYFNRTIGQNAYAAVFTGVGANQLALTTTKDNTALAKAFEAALAKMKTDGSYAKILTTWGVEPVESFAMNPTPKS